MEKTEVVKTLKDIASLLELSGANAFEIMAFNNGAENLDDWEGDLGSAVADATLTDIEGVGKGIASVVTELVTSGRSSKFDDLCGTYPRGLLDLLKVPGLGVKKVRMIHQELGLISLDELQVAIEDKSLWELPGFSEKSEERLRKGIERARERL